MNAKTDVVHMIALWGLATVRIDVWRIRVW